MTIAPRDVPRVLLGALVLAGCYQGSGGNGGDTGGSTSSADDGDPSDPSAPTAADDDDDDGPDDGVDDGPGDPTDASASDSTMGDDTSASAATGASADDASSGDSGSAADEMCMRWNADRSDLDEGTWSGSVASCTPGDITASARENALRVTNLYRWLADLPPIETDPARDQLAQACALMMDANDQLSHDPPGSWTCYSDDGADAAGSSNIASTAAVYAVDLYMVDPGNPTTLGHRRWILSNSIGPTGIGSTSDYSCMWTLGGSGDV
ncbi:MAG TPA: CAP domain-containing protein, partial [Nannocystaceae bacterium]|nr:CAP domain-containing protein [Nannocystaceae bacterium]